MYVHTASYSRGVLDCDFVSYHTANQIRQIVNKKYMAGLTCQMLDIFFSYSNNFAKFVVFPQNSFMENEKFLKQAI